MSLIRTPQAFEVTQPTGAMAAVRWSVDPSDHTPARLTTEHPTVVGLHGITAHARSFQRLADTDPGLDVVAPDLRGRGRSRALPPATFSEHADDVARLLDHLDLARVVVVGHSMGAFVATRLAHQHPDRVAALVLVDGALPLPGPAALGPALERLQMTFADREAYRAFWRQHPAFGPHWDEYVQDYVDQDLRDVDGAVAASATPEAVALNLMELDRGDDQGGLLTAISAPVSFVHAGRDLVDASPGMYPPEHAALWLARVPHWRVIDLDDVHHYGALLGERGARAVADEVRHHLARHDLEKGN